MVIFEWILKEGKTEGNFNQCGHIIFHPYRDKMEAGERKFASDKFGTCATTIGTIKPSMRNVLQSFS